MKSIWKKFDWPNHLWMAGELLMDRVMTLLGTWWGYTNLKFRSCNNIGSGLRVKGRLLLFVRRKNSIEIGNNVLFVSRFRSNPVGIVNPCVLDTLMGGKISLQDHVGLSGVILSSRSSITIGKYSMLGGNVRVFDHDYHSLDPVRRRDPKLDQHNVRTQPVVIGEDVFIGTNAIILKGVTIGDGAVIGAGSLVASNIPAREIWAGNPAVKVGKVNGDT